VIDKWKNNITPVILQENMGLACATNTGVFHATNDNIFICNDDQVFPKEFDINILKEYNPETDVMTANQIEPYDSMFRQFIKHDFGRTAKTFDMEMFYKFEPTFRQNKIDECGSTLPYLISKKNYIKTGGWDESYPSGNVVDWEVMLKYQLCGLKMKRNYNCNLYHFVSTSFKSPEMIEQSKIKEQQAFEYFKYKWGNYPKHDPSTNLKSL